MCGSSWLTFVWMCDWMLERRRAELERKITKKKAVTQKLCLMLSTYCNRFATIVRWSLLKFLFSTHFLLSHSFHTSREANIDTSACFYSLRECWTHVAAVWRHVCGCQNTVGNVVNQWSRLLYGHIGFYRIFCINAIKYSTLICI